MVTVKVNTANFDRAMNEYMKYTKRSLAESVNQHAYYASRNAASVTKAATKEEIETGLNKASNKYPNAPLVAILVNTQRGKEGKKGLTGEAMKSAIERFIRKRVNSRNFLRAGWIPAIKLLAKFVQKKNGTKIPSNTDKKGRNFGGASPAKNTTWTPIATVWNSAVGKDASPKAIRYLEEGAQKAIDMEVESMRKYIERKQEEASRKFFG